MSQQKNNALSPRLDEIPSDSRNVENSGTEQTKSTIEVQGFNPDTHDDTLQLYFENTKRSGGGDVIRFQRANHVVYVTFENEEIARRVCARQHKVENVYLDVKQCLECRRHEVNTLSIQAQCPIEPYELLTPQGNVRETGKRYRASIQHQHEPSFESYLEYDDKVHIQGLNPNTTKDCIFNFLEAKTNISPSGIVYREDGKSAVVTFQENIEFEKLSSACKQRQLENSYLRCSKVPVTNSIMITNVAEMTSKDTLTFYFENSRRSGGGDIESMKFVEDEETWLCYFKDHNVVSEVSKRDHTVDHCNITVKAFYPCLGIPQFDRADPFQERQMFSRPDPYTTTGTERFKVKFFMHKKSLKETLERELKAYHAEIQWPRKPGDHMIVHCTITPVILNANRLAKIWRKNVNKCISYHLQQVVEEKHKISKHTWDIFLELLDKSAIFQQDGVYLAKEMATCDVIVAGYPDDVRRLSKKMKEMNNQAAKILYRKTNYTTETFQARYHQLQLLSASGFSENMQMQFEDFRIDIDVIKKTIKMEGFKKDINQVKIYMYEKFQNIVCANLGTFPKYKADFYNSPKVTQYLKDKIENANISAYWEINEECDVVLYSLSDDDIVRSSAVFQQSVTEIPITVKPESSSLLQSQMWNSKITEVENIAPGLIKILEGNDIDIILLSAIEYEPFCTDSVEEFFSSNTVYEKYLEVSTGEIQILRLHHSKDMTTLMKNFENYQVDISFEELGIRIKATRLGLMHVEKVINDIIRNIKNKRRAFAKAVPVKYLRSDKGKALVRNVEIKSKCVIELSEKKSSLPDTPKVGDIASCVTPSGQKVSLMQGAITDLDVDVIVSTANKDLKLIGGLAKAIVNKGGLSIQTECDRYIKKNGQMLVGDVCCTGSGQLGCKLIVHAVGPMYRAGMDNDEEKLLREVVFKSLEESNHRDMRSMGIPALCTGYNRFPASVATRIIVGTLSHYFRNNFGSSIQHIYLCDIKEENVNWFRHELESIFGVSNVIRGSTAGNQTTIHNIKKDNK